jgi:hypothetical protein
VKQFANSIQHISITPPQTLDEINVQLFVELEPKKG